jgi:gamma-glutamylcyclotransferase
MSPTTMQRLCPGHRYLGVAELRDHRLAFTRRSVRTGTGVADILAAEGESAWGALYELDAPHLAALDAKEGNGWAYERQEVRVRLAADAEERAAIAYAVIDPEQSEVEPSGEYLTGLVAAAQERGLPSRYLTELIGRFD